MSDPTLDNLILDLLLWLASRDRSYQETIDVWRTSCPRLPVREEANDQGLVVLEIVEGQQMVRLTKAGQKLLAKGTASESKQHLNNADKQFLE